MIPCLGIFIKAAKYQVKKLTPVPVIVRFTQSRHHRILTFFYSNPEHHDPQDYKDTANSESEKDKYSYQAGQKRKIGMNSLA